MTFAERLRSFANNCDKDGKIVSADLFREAAAYIKKMEGELTAAYMTGFHKRDDEIESLKRECDKLRSLVKLGEHTEHDPGFCKYCDGIKEVQSIRDQREGK